jgi:predicted esterase
MERGFLRRSGAKAKIRAILLLTLSGPTGSAAQPITLAEGEAEPGVVVYPAVVAGPRSVTVVLHGMCSEPANICRHFAREVTAAEHLVCPRAAQRCTGGGSSWPQRGFVEQVEQAVQRAEAMLHGRVDGSAGRTLIGYSLGAFRALELAQRGAGKYPRVMLIGARVYPNPRLLRENGVERVLLSAGAWDMMHDHMRQQSQRLQRSGARARFLGLGPVGHSFTPSFADYLPEALRWLEADSRR